MAKDKANGVKKATDIVSQYAEIKTTVGNPPVVVEGYVQELGTHGVTLSYEHRGYSYLTLVPWTSVVAIEAATKLDEDDNDEKPSKPDSRPTKPSPVAAVARQ